MEFPKTSILATPFFTPFRVTNDVGWCRPVTFIGLSLFVTASLAEGHLSPANLHPRFKSGWHLQHLSNAARRGFAFGSRACG